MALNAAQPTPEGGTETEISYLGLALITELMFIQTPLNAWTPGRSASAPAEATVDQ